MISEENNKKLCAVTRFHSPIPIQLILILLGEPRVHMKLFEVKNKNKKHFQKMKKFEP